MANSWSYRLSENIFVAVMVVAIMVIVCGRHYRTHFLLPFQLELVL